MTQFGVTAGVATQATAAGWSAVAAIFNYAFRANDAEDATPPPVDGDTIATWASDGIDAGAAADLDTVTGTPTIELDYFGTGFHGVDGIDSEYIDGGATTSTLDTSANGCSFFWIGQVHQTLINGADICQAALQGGSSQLGIEAATATGTGTTYRVSSAGQNVAGTTEMTDDTTHLVIAFCDANGGLQSNGWSELNGVSETTTGPLCVASDVDTFNWPADGAGTLNPTTCHAFGYMEGEITAGEIAIVESYAELVGASIS